MNGVLPQGILGRARASFAPSSLAIGPNTYLTERDFIKMLGAALVVHAVIFTVAALMPHEQVTNIPVRALSFKLGDHDRVAAYVAKPVIAAEPTPAPIAVQVTQTLPKPAVERQSAPESLPVKRPKIYKITDPELPQPAPAIAPNPQQYVREVGAPSQQSVAAALAGAADGASGGYGAETTMKQQAAEVIRARYEQEISAWIQRHKFYPVDAGGREGRAVVRMRIDRSGVLRYYAIEQSSGLAALDASALDMIRRANPMPAVPASYPAGNLVEFLIPITFKAPQ